MKHSLCSLTRVALLACALLMLAGCSSVRHGALGRGGRKPSTPATAQWQVPKSIPKASQELLAEARSWLGTPYLYGGNDRKGVDCSGFVLSVYRDALDIPLPRNSAKQCEYCTEVSRENMEWGDLMFFATGSDPSRVSHVGIYVGDGRMIHSSSSRGVVVSDINSRYYVEHFLRAGKVERYHAMIDGKGKAKGKKKDSGEGNTAAEPALAATRPSQRKEKGNDKKPGRKSQVTYTPVASLPAPKHPAHGGSEAGDARARFLNQLIEQKLDSIIDSQ